MSARTNPRYFERLRRPLRGAVFAAIGLIPLTLSLPASAQFACTTTSTDITCTNSGTDGNFTNAAAGAN